VRGKSLKFIVWPFGIVFAMRLQRERESARIGAGHYVILKNLRK
jgi:hypothetical protein